MAEWITIGEGRIFGVVEADNPSLMLQAVMAWSDFGRTELIPIMNLEDAVMGSDGKSGHETNHDATSLA